MTQKQLIDQFCEFRGKCTTDDVVALNFAYEMLAPRWISVEEGLPPREQEVLICEKDGILGCNTFLVDARQKDYYNNSNTNNGWEWRSELGPTHWMPLPEAPLVTDLNKKDLPPVSCQEGNILVEEEGGKE